MYLEVLTIESSELLCGECLDNGESRVRCNDAWDEGESNRGVDLGVGVCEVKSKETVWESG